ncbi:MAG: rhodanese-like domain-containing protein [Pyrinomonadaceae bacterium]|nr:rhodanese-like domain-containing protein [Sphingobacteriaceae bacterium]
MEPLFNNDITALELKEKLSEGFNLYLVDVREPLEYHTYNIGGQNIPLGSLSHQINSLKHKKEEEIIVICQRGIRSETARILLLESGFTKVRNLTGGLLAYRKVTGNF